MQPTILLIHTRSAKATSGFHSCTNWTPLLASYHVRTDIIHVTCKYRRQIVKLSAPCPLKDLLQQSLSWQSTFENSDKKGETACYLPTQSSQAEIKFCRLIQTCELRCAATTACSFVVVTY